MRKPCSVEVLVNDTPNMATSERFSSREEAEAYAHKLYNGWDAAQAVRIMEKKFPATWSFKPIETHVGPWESAPRVKKV